MLYPPRFVPNDKTRRLYSIRGVVEGYDVHESGWYIFKVRAHVIRVRIKEGHLAVLNNTIRKMRIPNDPAPANIIAPVLQLGMTEAETKEYPVGTEVGITFGYARAVDQFFTGATPMEVMKLQVMRPGVQLDNEVLVQA